MFTFDFDTYSDIHKSHYGFRPRGEWFDASPAEKQVMWDQLMEANKPLDLEHAVAGMLELGAGDRTQALRWVEESYHSREEYMEAFHLPGW